MKKLTTFTTLCAFCMLFVAGTYATPSTDTDKRTEAEVIAALAKAEKAAISAAQWNAFGDNLVDALQSDIEGVQLSAMQLVIRYGDQVSVDKAVFDVVRLYRDNKDDDVRRMAVVALGVMRNAWAMDFLARSERFEKTPAVRKTIHAVVSAYQATQRNS